MALTEVEIYTDGACSGNPGPGGWGAVLRARGAKKEIRGGEPHTTNNRMELMAAIRALEVLRFPCRVTLHTDSTYVKRGITEWIPQWKQRGWKTAGRKPVKNVDLWQALEAALARHEVDWRWVPAHTGIEGNERADELARQAIEEME